MAFSSNTSPFRRTHSWTGPDANCVVVVASSSGASDCSTVSSAAAGSGSEATAEFVTVPSNEDVDVDDDSEVDDEAETAFTGCPVARSLSEPHDAAANTANAPSATWPRRERLRRPSSSAAHIRA